MTHIRRLGVPTYIVAGILILFPAMDLLQSAWPMQIGEVTWRVLTVGLLGRLILTPILGLLLAFAAALVLEQPRVLRALAVFSGVLFTILILGLIFYALDALQMRAQVRDVTETNYDLGIFISFTKYGIGLIILGVLAVTQRQAGKAVVQGAAPQQADDAPHLVFRKKTASSASAPSEGSEADGV